MTSSAAPSIQSEIERLVRCINDAWLRGRTDELAEYFRDDMVIVHPDFRDRTVGREACVESYRAFVSQASIGDFRANQPLIDIFDGTAVAAYEFEITYDLGGQTYRERGRDVFVFAHDGKSWQAAWRTVSYDRLFPSSTA